MKKYKEPVINRTVTTTELVVICLTHAAEPGHAAEQGHAFEPPGNID